MKFFNKYRIRRLVLYAAVIAITICAVLFLNYESSDSVYGLTFVRKPVEMQKSSVETLAVEIDSLSEENGFDINQCMMLINKDTPLPDGYEYEVMQYKDTGVLMNVDMVNGFSALSEAVKTDADDDLYVSSHLRTRDEQKALYDEDPKTATLPGCSEHETGLALDVYVTYYAGEGFLKSDAGKFVNTKCHEYGFIIRYPHYGEKETGIRFEPWHIRYVGFPHSKIIYENRLTLESYIDSLEKNVYYEALGYYISRQQPKDNIIFIPTNASEISVSCDNLGCYIVTAKINE